MKLAERNVAQAIANVKQLPPVRIVHFPIAPNETCSEADLCQLMADLEQRLRGTT